MTTQQSSNPVLPTTWNPFVDMTALEMADLKNLLNQAEVNPYTRNSGGGWGWRKGLSSYECDLIFKAWFFLKEIYDSQLARDITPALTEKGVAA